MTRDGATQFFISVVSVIFVRGVVIAPLSAQTGVDVATWHNDTHRTGQNLNETSITSSTLSTFGQFCSVQLDGQVYAQPLVVTNVTIGSTKYSSVVYVVTQNDTLYAIDGNPNDGSPPCKILNGNGNGTSLLTGLLSGQSPVACRNVGSRDCKTVSPVVGILGTPVINLVSSGVGAIYLVTESQDSSGNYYHYLHAVDIGNFTENSS